ncbi:MAG: fibrobacter succinogenes major paralogous domain-containing protein [Bacteroidota bacterium]
MYNTVQIGNQCWLQSNLKTSKYRNGDSIPTGLSNSDWWSTQLSHIGAYQMNTSQVYFDSVYGKLYNHYAVSDNRGLCPTGWHVPSHSEISEAVFTIEPGIDTNLVGWSGVNVGGKLKSTTQSPALGGWHLPNLGANNLTGFSAIPGGFADMNGGFYYEGSYASWWTSSEIIVYNAWFFGLSSSSSSVDRNNLNRAHGLTVRCLKN